MAPSHVSRQQHLEREGQQTTYVLDADASSALKNEAKLTLRQKGRGEGRGAGFGGGRREDVSLLFLQSQHLVTYISIQLTSVIQSVCGMKLWSFQSLTYTGYFTDIVCCELVI